LIFCPAQLIFPAWFPRAVLLFFSRCSRLLLLPVMSVPCSSFELKTFFFPSELGAGT
jgi:hypothetical protein